MLKKVIFIFLLVVNFFGCTNNNIKYENIKDVFIRNAENQFYYEFDALYLYIPFSKKEIKDIEGVTIKYKDENKIIHIKQESLGYWSFGSIFSKKNYKEAISVKEIDGRSFLRIPFYCKEYNIIKNQLDLVVSVIYKDYIKKFKKSVILDKISYIERPYIKTKYINNKYYIKILNLDKISQNAELHINLVNNDEVIEFVETINNRSEWVLNIEPPVYYASAMIKDFPKDKKVYMYKVVDMDKSDPVFGRVIFKSSYFKDFIKELEEKKR